MPEPLAGAIQYAWDVSHLSDGWIAPFKDAVKGVGYDAAVFKPSPKVKSIWELTLHAVQYLERLADDLTGTPHKQTEDWPRLKNPTRGGWIKLKRRAEVATDRVHAALQTVTDAELGVPPAGLKATRLKRITDIAIHDAYHAGQVIKLKQIYRHTVAARTNP